MKQYISFHKVLDYIKSYQVASPRLNDFGYGDIVYFVNDSGTTTNYPFLFVTPININYTENTTVYSLQLIFSDIVNTDLSNEKDVVSDMSLEARRFLSEIKRGFLQDDIDIVLPAQSQTFFERFNDHVGGVVLNCDIVVFDDINACDPYFYPLCPDEPIEQYLTTTISGSDIILDLYSDSGTTSATTALCKYSYSGMVAGDSGSTYYFTGYLQQGQSTKTIDTSNWFLYTGETLSSGGLLDITNTGCECPTNVNITAYTPVYITEYQTVLNRGISNGNELPSYQKQTEQNNFILELKTEGYWDLLRSFYLWNGDYTEIGFDSIEWKTGNNVALWRNRISGNPYIPTHDPNGGVHFVPGWDLQLANNLNNDTNGVHFGAWIYDDIDTTPDTYNKWYIGASSDPPRQGMSARASSGSHYFPSLNGVPVASSADMSGNGFRMMGNSGNTATNGVITFTRDTDELYYNGLTYSPTFLRIAPVLNFVANLTNPGIEYICSAYWNTNRGLDESERNGLRTLFQKYLTTA